MNLLVAIEGDQGTPVRMWKTVEKVDRKTVCDFIDRWGQTFEPEDNEFSPGPDKAERESIADCLLADGDSYWWDEEWCFQIHREECA